MSKKMWSVRFIAGNPAIMNKVRTTPDSPMLRSKALESAQVIANKGWRVWVENEVGNRIFESQVEKQFVTTD